jgi:hypothetical protein
VKIPKSHRGEEGGVKRSKKKCHSSRKRRTDPIVGDDGLEPVRYAEEGLVFEVIANCVLDLGVRLEID